MTGLRARAGAVALVLSLAATVMGQEGPMPLTIQEAKRKHEARLLAMPGVVSVGIGLDDQGRAVVVVGLDSPRPGTVKKLPTTLEGHPLQSRILGPVKAQEP